MDRKYPKNIMAAMMSYENRLKRYHEEKDKLLRENVGISAAELQKKLDYLLAWWGI